VNGIFKAVKSVRSGSIKLEIATQPALKIEIKNDYISNSNKMAIKLDLLDHFSQFQRMKPVYLTS
jgi:hypothetical protein